MAEAPVKQRKEPGQGLVPDAGASAEPAFQQPKSVGDALRELIAPSKGGFDRPPGAGMIVGDRAATLEPLQKLVIGSSWPGLNRVLAARYSFSRRPYAGSAIAAFDRDVRAFGGQSQTPAAFMLRGDEGRWRQWAQVYSRRVPVIEDTGTLSNDWLQKFAACVALPDPGEAVVVLIETGEPEVAAGAYEWIALARLLSQLPTGLAFVVTPVALDEDTTAALEKAHNVRLATDDSFDWRDMPRTPETRGDQVYELSGLRGEREVHVDEDTLGYAPYAEALAAFVLHKDSTPLTISIQGPWGKGKTTFMRFVKEEIRRLADGSHGAPKRRVAMAPFNAWQYDATPSIWAGLAQTAMTMAEDARPPLERWLLRLWFWLRENPLLIIGNVLIAVAALLVVAALVLVPPFTDVPRALVSKNVADIGGPIVVLAGVAIAVWRVIAAGAPMANRINQVATQPKAPIGAQQAAVSALKRARDITGRDCVRVIFIDDLDRCDEERILETLRAINLVLAESGNFVFLGIDASMLSLAVQHAYAQRGETSCPPDISRKYLEKIVQLSFVLPVTDGTRRLSLVRSMLPPMPASTDESGARAATDLADGDVSIELPFDVRWRPSHREGLLAVATTPAEIHAFERLSAHIPDNPREIIRLVNLHRLTKILLFADKPVPDDASQRLLVTWLLVCSRWPRLARAILDRAPKGPPDTDVLAAIVAEPEGKARSGLSLFEVAQPTPADYSRLIPPMEAFAEEFRGEFTAGVIGNRPELQRATDFSEMFAPAMS